MFVFEKKMKICLIFISSTSALKFIPHPIHPQSTTEKVLKDNIGLVHCVAKRFYIEDPMLDYEDMLQTGLISMNHAIYKFDCSRGINFSTFAYTCMYRAMSKMHKKRYKCVSFDGNPRGPQSKIISTRLRRNQFSVPELYVDDLMLLDAVTHAVNVSHISKINKENMRNAKHKYLLKKIKKDFSA